MAHIKASWQRDPVVEGTSHAGSLQDGGGLKASSLTGSSAPLGHGQALPLVVSAPLRPGIPPWERLQARDLLHCFLGDVCPQQ